MPWPDDAWRHILRNAVRSSEELGRELRLDPASLNWLEQPEFEVLVPRTYLARIQPRDPWDPLLLQVAAQQAELHEYNNYTYDPLNEQEFASRNGLIRKYRARVLLLTTAACPVHCRYCFRQHFPYRENQLSSIEATRTELAADSTIREVILSGGDPLSMSDSKFRELVECVDSVKHISILRVHTRYPVMIPQRVTSRLIDLLTATRLKTIVVLHINHPNEIDENVAMACQALNNAGIVLFNQSVLLRGINDSVDTLVELSYKMFDAGIKPYYLHMLDRVAGTYHFEVEEQVARQLLKQLRAELPGYLVPQCVREIPGYQAKTPVGLS